MRLVKSGVTLSTTVVITMAMVAALGLAGCSSSIGADGFDGYYPGQAAQSSTRPAASGSPKPTETPKPETTPTKAPKSSHSITVVAPEGQGDFAAVLDDFETATGIASQLTLVADVNEEKADAIFGVHVADDSSTAVGRDFACALINESWFEVNRRAQPATIADLAKPEFAAVMSLGDPATSADEALWLARIEESGDPTLKDFLSSLKAGGADFHAGQSQAQARIQVGSALLPWRTVNNLGTESQWRTLPDTCVTRQVFVAGEAAALDLVDFLRTADGQSSLANAGVAYPLRDDVLLPEGVELVAPLPATAADSPTKLMELENKVLTAWKAQVGTN